jgi:hypothetical protein
LQATASDDVSVVGVQFLRDGQPLGAEVTGPSYQMVWNTTAMANTNYTLSAEARDAAGNVGVAPGVVVTVNNTPPPPPGGQPAEAFCPGGADPDPAVLFCDDFEDTARLSLDYFEYGDDQGQFVPVAGEGVSGGHAMRALWEPGETGAGDLKVTFGRNPLGSNIANGQDFRDIYWRMWVKTGVGWSGSPFKLSRATALVGSNWAQSFIAHVWTDGGDALVLDPASGTTASGQLVTTTYNDFPNLRWLGVTRGTTPLFASSNSDSWYCVEAHVKLNDPGASDGEFELWIDDALEARKTAINWVGDYQDFGINTVFVENYWNGGAPGNRTRYLDNLVISTSRIGCDSSSTPPPTQSPPTTHSAAITARRLVSSPSHYDPMAIWKNASSGGEAPGSPAARQGAPR